MGFAHSLRRAALVFGLWVVFVGSALSVVFVTHKARLATHDLEMLRHEKADLHVESGQLMLEKSSLSAFVRIERLAVEKLGMSVPKIENVVLVQP